MNYSDLIIEREIVENEIKNVEKIIANESKYDSISSMHRIEDYQIILENLKEKRKLLY